MEPVLASFHFLMIFTTLALLVGEFLLLRLDLTGPGLKLLGRVDLIYGVFAILVVVSGLLRVFWGDVPAAKWASNHIFWTKMAVFGAIAVLSIIPTLKFLAWGKAFAATGALPDATQRKKVGFYVHLEMGLFILIPILATWMAQVAEAN